MPSRGRFLLGFVAALLAGAAAAQPAPPPRSIADVLAVLDQQKPDPQQVDRLRAEVAKQPPATSDPIDLRNFYMRRGLAANELGMVAQALPDFRKALEYMPPGDVQLWYVYSQIAQAEFRAGNLAVAVKMWQDGPNVAVQRGQKLGAWGALAQMAAAVGDLAGARKGLEEAETILNFQRNNPVASQWPVFNYGWRAWTARSRAHILRLEGKHADAERNYREAIALQEEQIASDDLHRRNPRMNMPSPGATLRISVHTEAFELVPALLEQGKYAEAEASARNALKRALGFYNKYSPETGTMLWRLAQVVFEQGRFDEASALARAALDIYEKIGAPPESTTVIYAKRTIAAGLVSQDKFAEAEAIFSEVRQVVSKNPETAERLGVGEFGSVYAQTRIGRTAQAVEQARAIYQADQRRFGDALYQTIEARGLLGLALAADNRHAEALREFREAIPRLLAAAGERTAEEGLGIGRANRLGRILEAYIKLLGHFAEQRATPEGLDPVGEAFLIADVARGSSVQRALTAASARAAISDPKLAQLAREEQDAGQRAASLTGILLDLLRRPADKSLPTVIEQLRRDIAELRKRRGEIKLEIAKAFPDYANLVDPKPVTLEQARRVLAPGEAMISFYGTDDRTFVWVVPQSGEARFHVAALGAAERNRIVAHLRRALDIDDWSLDRFPAFDVDTAHKLYSTLLAPLETAWGSARSLLIVPHGSLGQLPFGVLVTKPGAVAAGGVQFEGYRSTAWFLERAAITQLPSVNTLVALRSVARASAPAKPFIGFGDPVFGAQQVAAAVATRSAVRTRSAPLAARNAMSAKLAELIQLPDTAEELGSIAKALGAPQEDLYLGVRASEGSVKSTNLSDRRVVAFATHGLVPGELDGLTQPALALSNPAVTGEKDADGLLAMDEILGLKLNADWVVLSACNSGSASGANEEAVSGLGRAFFYAGARALLVSNWPVETVSAKLLTTDIFRRQATDAKLARAEALRQSMRQLMQNEAARDGSGKPMYSYAHPAFWAAFSLVGDGQ
jgi:CHAT domain-containing protein